MSQKSFKKIASYKKEFLVSERKILRRKLLNKAFLSLILLILVALIGIVFLTSCHNPFVNPGEVVLRLHGSNTIGKELAPALVEGYLKKIGAKNIEKITNAKDEVTIKAVLPGESKTKVIEIKAHGSDTAVKALENNECDIGMLSRKLKTDEVSRLSKLGDMTARGSENVIAMDGVAIIVNKSNPIGELSLKQIAQMFTGQIKDWSEIKNKNGESKKSGGINIYARNDESGTLDTFKKLSFG